MSRNIVLAAFKTARKPVLAFLLISIMATPVVMASLKDTTQNSYSLWQYVLQNPLQPMF